MNDIEHELREMFARREVDVAGAPPPSDGVVRRTRRRQAAVVLLTTVAVVALALVPILGARLGHGDRQHLVPVDRAVLPDTPPGFTAAALPFASIAYPEGWYLLDTSPLEWEGPARPYVVPSGPILQLANFDPDLPRAPKCMLDPDSLPQDGALLTVGITTPEGAAVSEPPSGPWPVELGPLPANRDPVCAGTTQTAAWTVPSGLIFWATAQHGPDASEADIEALEEAFSSLVFPPTDRPWMSQVAAFQGQGTPRVILGTEHVGSRVSEIVAYIQNSKALVVGVSSDTGTGSCCVGRVIQPRTEKPDEPVSSTVDVTPDGTLVYGDVAPEVARVEIRTSSGDAIPVTPVALPQSLGVDDRVAWGVVPGGDEHATMIGFDANGDILGNPTYPLGPDVTLGTGENEGASWTLTLTHDNLGYGVAFTYEGLGGGGGSGISLRHGEVFGGGMGSGGHWYPGHDETKPPLPQEITGLVTADAARVEYELTDGTIIEAHVYEMPDVLEARAKAFLVFVPNDVLVVAGDMVAYDSNGEELGREYTDFSPIFLWPKLIAQATPDALAVMRDLQVAGAVAVRYYETHGQSFLGLDPETASAISDAVTYNAFPSAVRGEVSLRVTGKDGLAISSATPNGHVYSACFESGPYSAVYCQNDPADANSCSNDGWL
ncbi:MAG: hypothetical protein AB1551_07095 [Actinomycetota bacterium]